MSNGVWPCVFAGAEVFGRACGNGPAAGARQLLANFPTEEV